MSQFWDYKSIYMSLVNLMVSIKKSKKPLKNIKIRLRKRFDSGRRHRSQPARLYPRWSVETFTSCARVAHPAPFFPRQTVEAALSSCARVGDSVCSNPRDSIDWLSSTMREREPASLHPASRCRLASSS